MRITGQSTQSSHHAGMSSLWHDIDYVPDRRIDVPHVLKRYEGEPLPTEPHRQPGTADLFARQEAAYDVAEAQTARGRKGMEFLSGAPALKDLGAAVIDRQRQSVVKTPGPAANQTNEGQHQVQLHQKVQQKEEAKKIKTAPRQRDNIGERMDKVAEMLGGLVGGMVGAAATGGIMGGNMPQAAGEVMSAVQAGVSANLALGTSKKMSDIDAITSETLTPNSDASAPQEFKRTRALFDGLVEDE